MNTKSKRWILVAVVVIAAAGAGIAWWRLRPLPLPPGLAVGNGRIEATQIDIATKLPGRIKEVLVHEGDFVEAGQVVAHMDTQTLEAELRQAQAQVATGAQRDRDRRRPWSLSARASWPSRRST